MTGRGRSRGSRAPSRRLAGSTSPSSRRVTRQQIVNIDPNLSGEPPIGPSQARRSTRQAAHGGAGTDGVYDPQSEYATPAPTRTILSSIEERGTPSQKLARVKLMRKFLDRLFSSCDDIFNHLLGPRDEAWQDELDGLNDAAGTFRKHYISDPDFPLIDLSYVLAKVEAEPNSTLWVATTKTVWAANLVQLLSQLAEINQGHHDDLLDDLVTWDSTFPGFFIPEKELVAQDDTFDQAMEIRTQLFITTLQSLYMHGHSDTDPLAELAGIFCTKDYSAEQLQAILTDDDAPMDFKEFADFDLSPETETRARLINRLRSIGNVSGSIESLQSTFPLDTFLKGFQAYAQDAYTRVKEALQLHGSVPHVPAIFEAAAQSHIATQLEADAAMARPRHVYDDGYHPPAPPSAQPISSYPPPETLYNPHGSAPSYDEVEAAVGIAAGQKRNAPEDGDDDAFETDLRVTQNKRKGPARPRTKRARKNQVPDGEIAPSGDHPAPVAQMDIYPDPMGSHLEPDVEALSQRAREVAIANRKPREPQTRTPWSPHDTKLLIRAVDSFKCKWSKIATEIAAGRIQFQHPRNQQALRDKARILKQDFLRTDGILPVSFDLVVLGKKEVENVKSVGRNPFRKEADVIDGRPVNTLLQPEPLGQELPHTLLVTHEPLELLRQEEHLHPKPEPAQEVDPSSQQVQPDIVTHEPIQETEVPHV